jgi:hypothetical protein
MLVQRLALYSTLGWLLLAIGQTWDTWGFWCVLGLFWASEHVTRIEVIELCNQQLAALRRRAQQESEEATDGNNKD